MPQITDLNIAPYYDDFDKEDNFHRVLFRPGFAIQARELTQLQTIMQNQIERLKALLINLEFQESNEIETNEGKKLLYKSIFSK